MYKKAVLEWRTVDPHPMDMVGPKNTPEVKVEHMKQFTTTGNAVGAFS